MLEVVAMTEAEGEIWSDLTKRRTNYIYIYIHSRFAYNLILFSKAI